MKSTNIQIRTSETFKEEIKRKADSLGLSISAYITMLVKKDLLRKMSFNLK